MWKIVSRMLRMEGMENVIEAKLENDKDMYGRSIVDKSIEWNNLLGMNLPGFGRNRRNKRTIKLVSAFLEKKHSDPSDTDSEGSEDTVAEFILSFRSFSSSSPSLLSSFVSEQPAIAISGMRKVESES
ncbi:hypothetical protein BLNAU_20776 [Blattamonas nauphoetae]|uniref:Uncharacterized protein n=1 Tax=Blattamonas nauphoetae TaxID=2049346 RepID=A0ABQ9WXU1_9EUKA|nr:hypothetical protein BLNAU_20776 [Blattamonas nauphoetae]